MDFALSLSLLGPDPDTVREFECDLDPWELDDGRVRMEGGDLVRSTTELLGRFPADLELELELKLESESELELELEHKATMNHREDRRINERANRQRQTDGETWKTPSG